MGRASGASRRVRFRRRTARRQGRRRRLWRRKFGLGYLIVRTSLFVPVVLADEPHPRVQDLAVDEVRIEGKLYSPQALFVVARPVERFERGAVVPHYMQLEPAAQFLPYRLRLPEATAAAPASAEATQAVPRRSP